MGIYTSRFDCEFGMGIYNFRFDCEFGMGTYNYNFICAGTSDSGYYYGFTSNYNLHYPQCRCYS